MKAPLFPKLLIPMLGLALAGCSGGSDGGSEVVVQEVAPSNGGGAAPQQIAQNKVFTFDPFPSNGRVTLVSNFQPPEETSAVTAEVLAAVEQGPFAGLARMALGPANDGSVSTFSAIERPACGTADVAALTMLMGEADLRAQSAPGGQSYQDLPEGTERDFALITKFRSATAAKVLEPGETAHCTVFAELDEQGNPCVSREKALYVAEAFDSNNPARPGSGIYDQVRAVFGSEWNQNPAGGNDTDDKIVIFFFRPETLGENLYGYTSPADQEPSGGELSNRSEIVYINSGKDDIQTLSTLAHEFQHLINQNQKVVVQGTFPSTGAGENVSINEGLSELAEEVCGFDFNFGNTLLADVTNDYLSRPEDHEFFDFFAAGVGYGQSFLFFKYVREHFGDSTIRAIATSPAVGKANLDAGLPVGFAETFRRWTVANYATNLDGDVPSIYRYPSGFRTDGDYPAGQLVGVGTFAMANQRTTQSSPLGAWSTIYLTYAGGDGSDLSLAVQTAAGSPVGAVYEALEGAFTSLQQ